MCGRALGCGFIDHCCRSSEPESRPALVRCPIERPGANSDPDATGASTGAFAAAEAGGRFRAGSGSFAQADRASTETLADVGARAPALAVAARLAVAVGLGRRRSAFRAIERPLAVRWPPAAAVRWPPAAAALVRVVFDARLRAAEAYSPLLAAAIPAEGR